MSTERLQVLITGQVQGVGFRPHVYHIAHQLQLTGSVKNTADGVLIELQGLCTADFIPKLTGSLPSLARIDSIKTKKIIFSPGEHDFQIIKSESGGVQTMIAPDTSICGACLQELFDPKSRYFHYPFLNCTQCGPRLTITRNLPYDRHQTSMDAFPLCAECQRDYADPSNRRYHAQPTACIQCGPRLTHSIDGIAEAISKGKIVALKGVGGYQLICDARNDEAVRNLRRRKNRDEKPLAVMFANISSLHHTVHFDLQEKLLLLSRARPIVLLKKHVSANKVQMLSKSIAPGLSHLGIMLPSSPLHYLLFHALAGFPSEFNGLDKSLPNALVVTSANISGNPLIIDDNEAQEQLASIADLIVSYDRQIVTRADDSVMRVICKSPAFIRRARGFAPAPIKLPYAIPSTLALGGALKNTFCITRNDEAFVSQHIGGLTNKSTIEFFHESLIHWTRLLNVKVEHIACDSHPDFYTTQLANDYHLEIIPVQHHHAHLASVAAEHHIICPALGLALDGYGYGSDGGAWGGELMLFDNTHFQRLAHLSPLPQPGNDLAAREPWRMGAAALHALGLNHLIVERFPTEPRAHALANFLKSSTSIPMTTSCGRLFDAASALLGLTHVSSFEGQAAMQLESLVTELDVLSNGWYFENGQLNLLPTLKQLLTLDPVKGANLFHGTLIAALTEWITTIAQRISNHIIVLSGGCFLNKVLAEGLTERLTQRGFKVYLPQQLPPNDGGLSLGQAFIAGTKGLTHVSGHTRSNHQIIRA